ncbi:MAG: hypothetical protein AAF252_04375 [Pseudomonadota bacterium]
MFTPNEITAVVTLIMFALAGYALRFVITHIPAGPSGWLFRWALSIVAAVFVRLFFWDVALPTAIAFEVTDYLYGRHVGNWLNAAVNLSMAASTIVFLGRALLLTLPEDEQPNYSIWTVWFFPHGIRLFRRRS